MKRTTAGLFFIQNMSSKTFYTKPALDIDSQLKQLKDRGILTSDNDRRKIEMALNYIGYYRLSGYWKIFEQENENDNHLFNKGTNIDDILELYNFDRKLRLHFLDALERIEISIKSLINNHMSIKYTPFWFLDKTLFKDEYGRHVEDLFLCNKALKDPHHEFLIHYKSKYSNPHAPSWMILEALNFTDISKTYSFLKNLDAKKIADVFHQSPRILKSWLRSLTHTRNICAHHSRLWNRQFTILPEESRELKNAGFLRGYLGEQILIIWYFLRQISSQSSWIWHLESMIDSSKTEIINGMGLKPNWLSIIENETSSD
jgi:abortive infection bacteriophage resistance protein